MHSYCKNVKSLHRKQLNYRYLVYDFCIIQEYFIYYIADVTVSGFLTSGLVTK